MSTIIDGASAVVLCGHPRLGSRASATSLAGGMMGGKVTSSVGVSAWEVEDVVVGKIGVGCMLRSKAVTVENW